MNRICFLLFLLPVMGFAQQHYDGIILETESRKPIAFVSLALLRENVGTNSDEKGEYVLHSFRTQPNDTVLISSVGYRTLRLPVTVFKQMDSIWLERMPVVLKPVDVVAKKNWIRRTLNDMGRCGTDYLEGTIDMHQIAQLMEADTVGYYLSSITICKYAIPLIQPDKCIFRLQILSYDSITGGPGALLNDSIIEVKTAAHRVLVNLDGYHLRVLQRRFYVVLEWLRIPYNGGTEKYKMDGVKIRQTVYSPLICHQRYSRQSPRPPEAIDRVWYRDYRGRWKP
ncbi:MAG TPA: carboxypeptidase-like regulatory domain-containing protein, partial [Ferruginibacter sp.]|nr:carboxypeptidase-like regulatory domain-containing protein [Ferruginibacter sp.]